MGKLITGIDFSKPDQPDQPGAPPDTHPHPPPDAAIPAELVSGTRIKITLETAIETSGDKLRIKTGRLKTGLESLAEETKKGITLEELSLNPLTVWKFIEIYSQIPVAPRETIDTETINTLAKAVIKSLIELCRTKKATKKDIGLLKRVLLEIHPQDKTALGIADCDISAFEYETIIREAGKHLKKCLPETCENPETELNTRNIYTFFKELEAIWPNPQTFPGTTRRELKAFMGKLRTDKALEREVRKNFPYFGIKIETFTRIVTQEMVMESDIYNLIYRLSCCGESRLKEVIIDMAESNFSKEETTMIRKFLSILESEGPRIKILLRQCRANNFENLPELENRLYAIPVPGNVHLRPFEYFGTTESEIKAFKQRFAMKEGKKD